MQIPDEALFTIMLYADDKTLRRIATTSTQGYKIYNDAYFLDQQDFIEPNANNFMNVNRAMHEYKFHAYVSLSNYNANYESYKIAYKYRMKGLDVNLYNKEYDYLDEYILPPRTPYDTMDDYDHDEFIYHNTFTLQELDEELDNIAETIKVFKK